MPPIDRGLFFGHDPAIVLHDLLGTGLAAHLMSFIYIAWIAMVPVTLAAALVWSRNVSGGSWLVTAMGVDWVLGVATYPGSRPSARSTTGPSKFTDLPHTSVTSIQETMMGRAGRGAADPLATDTRRPSAAFASLHVGITVTVCVIAHLLGLNRCLRYALWPFLFLTILATVYLGWHYFADSLGGLRSAPPASGSPPSSPATDVPGLGQPKPVTADVHCAAGARTSPPDFVASSPDSDVGW